MGSRTPSPPRGREGAAARGRVWSLGLLGLLVYVWEVHAFRLGIAPIAIGVAFIGAMSAGRRFLWAAPFNWYVAFLAWALLGVASSHYPELAWKAWQDQLKIFAIGVLVFNILRTPPRIRMFLISWLALFALYPVRGTLFNFVFGIQRQGRYAWNYVFANENDLAAFCLLMMSLSLMLARSPDRRWLRRCAAIGVVVLLLVMLITQSRGGILGLAGFLIMVLLAQKQKLKMLAWVTVAIAIGATVAPSSVWDRVRGLGNLSTSRDMEGVDPEGSAQQRYTIWKVAREMIDDNPIAGIGLGTYSKTHKIYADRRDEWRIARGERDTHSTYLNVMAETGVIGFLIFVAFLVSVLRTTRKRDDVLNLGVMLRWDLSMPRAGFIGLLVCAVFGGLFNVPYAFLFVGFLLAATYPLGTLPPAPARAPEVEIGVLPSSTPLVIFPGSPGR